MRRPVRRSRRPPTEWGGLLTAALPTRKAGGAATAATASVGVPLFGRWPVRLAFVLPFALLAWPLSRDAALTGSNRELAGHGDAIRWGADQLYFLREAYPPLPTGIAGLLPSGTFGLALVGAVAAGITLEIVWTGLAERGYPRWLRFALLAAIGATPAFLVTALGDLAAFASLTLLAMAIAGMFRLVTAEETEGGLQAGLALGVAAACDLRAVVYAMAMALAAPLIARRYGPAAPGSTRATLLVVLFPTFSAIYGWAFLEWRFTGSAFATVTAEMEPLSLGGSVARAGTALLDAGIVALSSPLFLVAVGLIAVATRAAVALVLVLPAAVVGVSALVGLPLPTDDVAIILLMISMLALPRSPARWQLLVLAPVAVIQLMVTWTIRVTVV